MARAKVTTKTAAAKRTGSAGAKRAPPRSAAENAARDAVIEAGLELERSGLTPGRSGNVSLRFEDGMLITPSGMPYSEIRRGDIVRVAGDGDVGEGQCKPSSEWRFHLSALKARPDRHAVIHTHSMYSTVLACRHEPIPAFHYMVAVAGGTDIPCVPYALFGTDELAGYVAEGLAERDACLMANHGVIAIATDLAKAMELLREVEELARQYVNVLTLGGPKLLNKKQMAEVLQRFKSYGQNAQKSENS